MKTVITSFAFGVGLLAAPALAQAPGGGWMQRDQTRAEAQQRADMMFQMLDANHDGTVTKAEAGDALAKFQSMQGGEQEGRGGGRMRMMQGLVQRLFAAQPSITQQQFEAMMLSRFDAMDLNHDGTVTAAEREQYREQRRGGEPATAPAGPGTPQ